MTDSRTIVITGANRGIGLQLVRHFASQGARVIATYRDAGRSAELLELIEQNPHNIRGFVLNVADASSVEEFEKMLVTTNEPVDTLINNAGMLKEYAASLESLSFDQMELMFGVNTWGPMRVTRALLPLLRKSSNPVVVNMSSKVGSIADNSSGGAYGYRMSKAALNMFNKSFSIEQPEIISVVLHPGWVKTDMGGPNAPTTPEESVAGLVKQITGFTKEHSGRFFDFRGAEIPW